jgi:hypothetical protein
MSKKEADNKNKEPKEPEKKDSKVNFFQKIFQSKREEDDNLKVLEADLVKDRVEVKFDWRKNLKVFLIFFSLAFIIVLEAYLLLFWWENQKVDESSYYLEKEISILSSKVDDLNEGYQSAKSFDDKTKVAFNFLNKHVYWTNFFSFLEKRTLKKHVYYENFSGDIKGKYSLPAITDDVRAINFQSKYFLADSMVLQSTIDEEEIVSDTADNRRFFNFKINLNLKKGIFEKK